MWSRWALLGGLSLNACATPEAPAAPSRAALHRTGANTFELVPEPGQHPWCLAYTVTGSGLIRQLTMSATNQSFECPAGRAVGQRAFKVPVAEGPVRVYVLFTSQPVNAASVSQQLVDAPDRQALSAMQLRLPGAAALEALDFVPDDGGPARAGQPAGDGEGRAP